ARHVADEGGHRRRRAGRIRRNQWVRGGRPDVVNGEGGGRVGADVAGDVGGPSMDGVRSVRREIGAGEDEKPRRDARSGEKSLAILRESAAVPIEAGGVTLKTDLHLTDPGTPGVARRAGNGAYPGIVAVAAAGQWKTDGGRWRNGVLDE